MALKTDDEIEVFNRACGFGTKPVTELREADNALSSLLRAHGLICNGGVYHAVEECLTAEQLQAACEGYRYFGLNEAADLLEKARKMEKWGEDEEEHFNNWYYDKFLRGVIEARFQEHFINNRGLYAP